MCKTSLGFGDLVLIFKVAEELNRSNLSSVGMMLAWCSQNISQKLVGRLDITLGHGENLVRFW